MRRKQPAAQWSVGPTLLWFVGLVGAGVWLVDGAPTALGGIVQHRPGDDDQAATQVAAGPSFVTHTAPAAAVAEPEAAEPEAAELVAVASSSATTGGGGVTGAGTLASTSPGFLTDTCVEPLGASSGCKRFAMDAYYDALARVERGEAVARASLFGDSVISADYVTAPMRARLAARFGDGGPGWLYLAKPNRWYENQAARLGQSEDWSVNSVVFNPSKDGLLGPGGVSFVGVPGSWAQWSTGKRSPGDKASRLEIYYLAGPSGGEFELTMAGQPPTTVTTRAEAVAPGWHRLDASDGELRVKLRVLKGRFRGFGVTLERARGVVVDNFGLMGGTAKALAVPDESHFAAQVAHRAPDLIMVQFGANESNWLGGDQKAAQTFGAQFERALARIRRARPGASCLVISTLDAARVVDGKVATKPAVANMVEAERAAAARQGCAFFDARAFMGGEGAAQKWRKKGLFSGDLTHPTRAGGSALGGAVADAIIHGYQSRSRR